MGRVHVDFLAPPGNRLTPPRQLQTREIDDRARWSVLARNPFRINQRQRPGRHRHCHARMKKFAWRFGGVDAESDGGRWQAIKPRFAGDEVRMNQDYCKSSEKER